LKEELIRNAIAEIERPTFATTIQYLEVHDVEMENGKPKAERVDLETFDGANIVYFPIQNEPFFFICSF